ncbi:SCP-like protein [Necator americanus]|uniref:SCP-like protein n=1 Tax=Necator americanus TaxID=51031 RepID=W2TW66_NECAM|nr:SCP-like protein [Necator americanus]ETN85919.1 SCP-like protein [Necator americanus]
MQGTRYLSSKAAIIVVFTVPAIDATATTKMTEVLAQAEAKKCGPITTPKNYGSTQNMISVKKTCDATETVRKEISTWWKDGATQQTSSTKVDKNDKFSQMAYFETSAVACSYYPCTATQLSLVCLYNKNGAAKTVKELYNNATGKCNCTGCTAYLCPSEFTPAQLPSSVCSSCAPSSELFREVALYSHNYYRHDRLTRLVATGWAEDKKSKYAKPAKAMMELQYNKTLEDKAKKHVNKATCPTTPQNAEYAGESFWTSEKYSLSEEEAVKKAIEKWFSYLKNSGLGDNMDYTSLKKASGKQLANVIHDKTTSVGCFVKRCEKQGAIVVDCRYDPYVITHETNNTATFLGVNVEDARY